VDVDGSNDRLLFQAPDLTSVMAARWSPDGKRLAALLVGQILGADGKTPVIHIDHKLSPRRIAVFDAATGEHSILPIKQQDGVDVHPVAPGELQWR
jgi:hypothetical protein